MGIVAAMQLVARVRVTPYEYRWIDHVAWVTLAVSCATGLAVAMHRAPATLGTVAASLAVAAAITLWSTRRHVVAIGRRPRLNPDDPPWGVYWRLGVFDGFGEWFDAPIALQVGLAGEGRDATLWAVVRAPHREVPRVLLRQRVGARAVDGVPRAEIPTGAANEYLARDLTAWIERARWLTDARHVITLTAVPSLGAQPAPGAEVFVVPRDGPLHEALVARPCPFVEARDDLEGLLLALHDRHDAQALRAAIAWLKREPGGFVVQELAVNESALRARTAP